ncbi:MAG: glycosyltransferase family 1 protein, partial [Gammaproteobacteria bacterium]
MAESLAPRLLPEVKLHLVSRRRNRLFRLADMLYAVLRYGRQEQPVLIDVYSTLNFWYAVLSAAFCRIRGLRYFCVLRGGNLPRRLKQNPFLCQVLFGGAEKLIAPSRYLQVAFQEAGYDAVVIPNGI